MTRNFNPPKTSFGLKSVTLRREGDAAGDVGGVAGDVGGVAGADFGCCFAALPRPALLAADCVGTVTDWPVCFSINALTAES